MQILVLPAFQPVFLQPCADGDVVEFQGRTGYEDGQDKDAGGYHDMGVQRGVRVGVFPVEQHVYQREVGDVEREGEFSEKVAYLLAPEDEGAPPESAFHTDEPAESGDEKSAEERIEQAGQAYVYLFRREAPTFDRGVHLGISRFRQQSEDIQVQAQVKRQETCRSDQQAKDDIRQFSENECIQDISQILPRQRPVRSVESKHTSLFTTVTIQIDLYKRFGLWLGNILFIA